VANDAIKPIDENDLKRIISLQFGVKLVDMGNACYIDN
jgi:serine/threonine-protein kinase SRPK3